MRLAIMHRVYLLQCIPFLVYSKLSDEVIPISISREPFLLAYEMHKIELIIVILIDSIAFMTNYVHCLFQ